MNHTEMMSTQGTRLSERAPWETYAEELDLKLDENLAAQVAAYSERRHEDTKNSQMQEELHRQKEFSNEVSKEYQWIAPEEYQDFDARIGRVMSHSEFITILREQGIRCWYRQHPAPGKITLLWLPNEYMAPEVACWVQYGQMPELSIMRFDEHGVPLDERRRGWRTPLLQLILQGVISEERAHVAFGKPRMDAAFNRYNRTLYDFRNAGSRLSD